LKENKKIYISEKSILECPGNYRKMVEEDKYTRLKNSTVYFLLIKALLAKKKFNLRRKI
jgi:hypothetical protein